MDWKRNKTVGIIAVIVLIVAIVVIATLMKPSEAGYGKLTFVCESSGQTFEVSLAPGSRDADNYANVQSQTPYKCKFDDKNDAYLARQNPETGKWEKMP